MIPHSASSVLLVGLLSLTTGHVPDSAIAAAPPAAPAPGFAPTPAESEWTEHLIYPLLDAPTFGFYVSIHDLLGQTFEAPEERVESLRERIDEGEDDLDVQLQLVRALSASGERDEARELLDDLARGLIALLREDPEDWESVAALGEVSRVTGTLFLEREALDASLRMLRAARANDDERWDASASLSKLFLWQSGRLRRADETEKAEEALERSRRCAEDAIEVADDEFLGHGLRFLIDLTESSFEYEDDAEAGLEHMVEIADALAEAAGDAPDPDVATATGDMYVLLYLLRACQSRWNTVEAFTELAEGDSEGSARAAYAEDIIERVGAFEDHHRLWPTVALTRWWLARHAEHDDRDDLFDAALDASDDPGIVLESAVGLETRAGDLDTAEAFCEQLLEEREDERSLYLAGRLAGMRGDFEASIEAFEGALEEDDEHLESRIGLAISLLKEGEDLERAHELLEEALEEDDELYTAHFALGAYHALTEDFEAAQEEFELAQELAEEDPIADFAEIIETASDALDG